MMRYGKPEQRLEGEKSTSSKVMQPRYRLPQSMLDASESYLLLEPRRVRTTPPSAIKNSAVSLPWRSTTNFPPTDLASLAAVASAPRTEPSGTSSPTQKYTSVIFLLLAAVKTCEQTYISRSKSTRSLWAGTGTILPSPKISRRWAERVLMFSAVGGRRMRISAASARYSRFGRCGPKKSVRSCEVSMACLVGERPGDGTRSGGFGVVSRGGGPSAFVGDRERDRNSCSLVGDGGAPSLNLAAASFTDVRCPEDVTGGSLVGDGG